MSIPLMSPVTVANSPVVGPPKDATCRSLSPCRIVASLTSSSDTLNPRALGAANYASGTAMTAEACISYCADRSFIYAGTEYSVRAPPLRNLLFSSLELTSIIKQL